MSEDILAALLVDGRYTKKYNLMDGKYPVIFQTLSDEETEALNSFKQRLYSTGDRRPVTYKSLSEEGLPVERTDIVYYNEDNARAIRLKQLEMQLVSLDSNNSTDLTKKPSVLLDKLYNVLIAFNTEVDEALKSVANFTPPQG